MRPVLTRSSVAAADLALVTVSGPTPFRPGCNGAPQTGTSYPNAEVEPFVSVNPRNQANVVGVWQQDRWSNGGANGLLTGVSRNGGRTWTRTFAHFSRCAGGNAANKKLRASRPSSPLTPPQTQTGSASTGGRWPPGAA